MTERWAPIPDWPEYEVSDHGRVRRLAPALNTYAGRVRKLYLDRYGYFRVVLCRDNVKSTWLVHRLVAAAFLPAPTEGREHVAHNDGDPRNNRLSNLRWATAAENTADRVAHGTVKQGEALPQARLTASDVVRLRADAAGRSQQSLAEAYGVSASAVSLIISRKRWGHVA